MFDSTSSDLLLSFVWEYLKTYSIWLYSTSNGKNVSRHETACYCMVAEGSQSQGDTPTFKEEGICVLITSLWLLVGKFRKTGFIKDLPRASRPSILVREHYEFIDECMVEIDELTACCLRSKLQGRFPEFYTA